MSLSEGCPQGAQEPLLRVMALHALVYCERLFYLEEVEELRVADHAVYDGRRAHEELEGGVLASFTLEAPALGLRGRVDAIRRQDGTLIPIEVKRGHAAKGEGADAAWRTDRVQIGAYALLLEETQGVSISEGRVRYLADRKTVRLPVDEELRAEVRGCIARARMLRQQVHRPPVTDNERLCPRCSLAPVCLPEEERLAQDGAHRPTRLFPPHGDRLTLHVLESGTQVGRRGDELVVRPREGEEQRYPVRQVGSVVIHGYGQITTQGLRLCADHEVAVQWMTTSGLVMGWFGDVAVSAQRHLRQFEALREEGERLRLAKQLVRSKVEMQLQFLLRSTRGAERGAEMEGVLRRVREALALATRATDAVTLLGCEGAAAAAYFEGLGQLLREGLDERLRYGGRSRRPSGDRFNALLNYGYGMLYREVLAAISAVGLHPGVGFYHRPRSAAPPLVLDLMELFRVPLVDMALVGALNRGTFDADGDFVEAGRQVWLSDSGRSKAIELFERRKQDEWRHNVVGYSLSYSRLIELEVRLLEKELNGEGRLFGQLRIR